MCKPLSVFTCATDDYCPLWHPLAPQRDGILLSDAQSLDHRTVPGIAHTTKIVEQPTTTADQ